MPDLIRHPESAEKNWIPAFAGMTVLSETAVTIQTLVTKEENYSHLYSVYYPNPIL
jgi:hypothetical protein